MADTTRGWTSSTVTPLYLRQSTAPGAVRSEAVGSALTPLASRAGVPSGGALPQNTQPGVSSYKYARTRGSTPSGPATPSAVKSATDVLTAGPGGEKPELNPLKVYGLEDFATTNEDLTDQSLGSRAYASVPATTGASVPATISTFQGGNVPQFLQQQIAQLNSEQYLKRSLQQDFIDRLFREATEKGNYQAWEALRAVGIQPGAHASFAAPVVDPAVQTAQAGNIQAQAKLTGAQTSAVKQPQVAQFQLNQLERERARLGPTPFGFYEGSKQQKLDKQIFDLKYGVLAPTSPTTQVAVSAAKPNVVKQTSFISPLMPALPTF